MIKNDENYITSYKYKVRLGELAEKQDTLYLVWFNGLQRIITDSEFEFSSFNKLSRTEVEDMLRKTKGILDITGEFLYE